MTSSIRTQRGGTLLGFIFGLIVGVAVSLALAVYVTKVPIPFINKGLTHSADQDANEDKKNKDWDPNAPLYNKKPPNAAEGPAKAPVDSAGKDRPSGAASTTATPPGAPSTSAPASSAGVPPKPETNTNPLASVFGPVIGTSESTNASNPAGDKADPMADLARSKANGIDAFLFFVQAGAFRTHDEADTQKGKLALAGFDTTLSERDQGGKTIYRVRVGPLNTKDEADKIQQKLAAMKVDSVVVRVQK